MGVVDRVLWEVNSLDHHRLDAILQEVEVASQEGPYDAGAMGVH